MSAGMRDINLHDLIRRPDAREEAGRQYARAVERHFNRAERLLRWNQTEAADRVAKGAVALRMDARFELR